jgi:hypothetical protein
MAGGSRNNSSSDEKDGRRADASVDVCRSPLVDGSTVVRWPGSAVFESVLLLLMPLFCLALLLLEKSPGRAYWLAVSLMFVPLVLLWVCKNRQRFVVENDRIRFVGPFRSLTLRVSDIAAVDSVRVPRGNLLRCTLTSGRVYFPFAFGAPADTAYFIVRIVEALIKRRDRENAPRS